jgi:hypothetical protein
MTTQQKKITFMKKKKMKIGFSNINHNIKHRQKPRDIFLTPEPLAKMLIQTHSNKPEYIWYDPFKNTGNFYNNYPAENEKDWSEIQDNKDFFKYNKPVDIIASNPPYSCIDKVFEHTFKICKHECGYLIGIHNLTPNRIEKANKAGFYLKYIQMFKVYNFFGMSIYVIFSKDIDKNLIDINRKVWR